MTGDGGKSDGSSGVKIVRRTLADGTIKEYRYRRRRSAPRRELGALRAIFNEYSVSPEFRALCIEWRERKLWLMNLIEARLGWMQVADLEKREARTAFYALRDHHADRPHRADKMMQTLSSILQWAYDRGKIGVNHAARIGALSEPRRSVDHYTAEQEEVLIDRLPDDLRRLYLVALYTGLRRGDLCALRPDQLDRDGWLVVTPRKTAKASGVAVHLPVFALPPLRDALGALPLTTLGGLAWTEMNVSHRWRRAVRPLGIGLRFHDIRHTTATRLVEAGCTEAERAAILGHALAGGAGAAYVARTRALSLNAYRKWSAALAGGARIVRFAAASGK